MKAALLNPSGLVVNVIVWGRGCTAPEGTIAHVVDDSVRVAPGDSLIDGEFVSPEPPPLESGEDP